MFCTAAWFLVLHVVWVHMFCTPSLYPRPCLVAFMSCARFRPPARFPFFFSCALCLFLVLRVGFGAVGTVRLLASIAILLEHRICCRLPTAVAASCWPPLSVSVSVSFISRIKSNKFPSPYIIPSYFFSPKTSSLCHYYLLYIAVVAVLLFFVLSSSSPLNHSIA